MVDVILCYIISDGRYHPDDISCLMVDIILMLYNI